MQLNLYRITPPILAKRQYPSLTPARPLRESPTSQMGELKCNYTLFKNQILYQSHCRANQRMSSILSRPFFCIFAVCSDRNGSVCTGVSFVPYRRPLSQPTCLAVGCETSLRLHRDDVESTDHSKMEIAAEIRSFHRNGDSIVLVVRRRWV